MLRHWGMLWEVASSSHRQWWEDAQAVGDACTQCRAACRQRGACAGVHAARGASTKRGVGGSMGGSLQAMEALPAVLPSARPVPTPRRHTLRPGVARAASPLPAHLRLRRRFRAPNLPNRGHGEHDVRLGGKAQERPGTRSECDELDLVCTLRYVLMYMCSTAADDERPVWRDHPPPQAHSRILADARHNLSSLVEVGWLYLHRSFLSSLLLAKREAGQGRSCYSHASPWHI
jgi:hypothetical protein